MGICSDIMHDFVLQEIKRIYSSYDGWKITPDKKGTGYDTLFHLERRVNGNIEIVKVFVTFKQNVAPEMLADLTNIESSRFGTPVKQGITVIVPAGADTSGIPAGINIFTMNSFAFDGDNLIWVKKPTRQPEENTAKPATGQTA
jgi:hypothetical protein